MSPPQTSTVILGAGIIGVASAYYLSEARPPSEDHQIHLVETSSELFSSASGKAGGFLAADWFAPASAPLGALSFALHRELAAAHNGHELWSYSPSIGSSFTEASGPPILRADGTRVRGDDWLRDGTSRAEVAGISTELGDGKGVRDEQGEGAGGEGSDGEAPVWLTRREGDEYEVIGKRGSVAQVDPLKLSHWLLNQCLARGVHLHQPASATSIVKDSHNTLTAINIHYRDTDKALKLPCTSLILSAGAWTPSVHSTLFPTSPLRLPITPLAGHSLVLRSPHWPTPSQSSGETQTCHAVFATGPDAYSPELISRPGEIWLGGLNDATMPLPERPEQALPRTADLDSLWRTGVRMCGAAPAPAPAPAPVHTRTRTTADTDAARAGGVPAAEEEEKLQGQLEEKTLEIVRSGLCFRPVASRGVPIVTRLRGPEQLGDGVEGDVIVAAGHGPWGISLALGTGCVVARMVRGVGTGCDVSRLGV